VPDNLLGGGIAWVDGDVDADRLEQVSIVAVLDDGD